MAIARAPLCRRRLKAARGNPTSCQLMFGLKLASWHLLAVISVLQAPYSPKLWPQSQTCIHHRRVRCSRHERASVCGWVVEVG